METIGTLAGNLTGGIFWGAGAYFLLHQPLQSHASSCNYTNRKFMELYYRVYKKKLNKYEFALNFAKQLLVSSF